MKVLRLVFCCSVESATGSTEAYGERRNHTVISHRPGFPVRFLNCFLSAMSSQRSEPATRVLVHISLSLCTSAFSMCKGATRLDLHFISPYRSAPRCDQGIEVKALSAMFITGSVPI